MRLYAFFFSETNIPTRYHTILHRISPLRQGLRDNRTVFGPSEYVGMKLPPKNV